MILIGLDPGKETGVAVWDCQGFRFLNVMSMPIHKAMPFVLEWKGWRSQYRAMDGTLAQLPVLVVWEDARQRRVFTKMDEKQAKYGAAVREGAGAAKRDAQIWADFLDDETIPNLPKKPHRTKQNHDQFHLLARNHGHAGRTNEHSRDAGMLVVQTNEPTALGMLRKALERQSGYPAADGRKAAPTAK